MRHDGACFLVSHEYNVQTMGKKHTSASFSPLRPDSDAEADVSVRPGAPAAEPDEGKKSSLSPEARRAFESGLKRFDALYRKLAE